MFFKPSPSNSLVKSPPRRNTFSDTLMDEKLEKIQFLISKWDLPKSSDYHSISYLFAAENRLEAKQYISSIKELRTAMQFYISENPTSERLVQAHKLMVTAVKRLEMEFYQILKSNREHLDPESMSSHSSRASRSSVSNSDVEDESEDDFSRLSDDVSEVERASMVAMANLKAIADCMIGSGYGKECVKIYKISRKSIVDEALYHLNVERLSPSQVQKLDWEVLELKIKHWLHAINIAVKTLFSGERILCDHVFSSSPSIRESCFTEITKEGALRLFGFPESVARCKKTPEKMFRILDLYEAISDLWPDIESIFNSESTSLVRSQAVNSLTKLRKAVRTMLTDFESAISKDKSKIVPGGGIHPLNRYVMNYLTVMADYSGALNDIFADWPLKVPSLLSETYFASPVEAEDGLSSTISIRLAWMTLLLLCKLDVIAALYKDVALSYLSLASNLQYVINKVRTSSLKLLLGDDWVVKHEAKVKQYAANYERMGWGKVVTSLPPASSAEIPLPEVKECFKRFNAAFDEAYKMQSSWIVTDSILRDEIKNSLARKLVPAYEEFYGKHRPAAIWHIGDRPIVKFAPDDLQNYLSDLLHGTGVPGSVSSSHSSSSGHSRASSHRAGGGAVAVVL